MGFLSVCTAVYNYQPQADGELEIKEGDTLYILEKGEDDDWWKAKKRVPPDDEDEPVGLIPNNYVEEAKPTHSAKALYDYTRQTEEEVTFTEDATLEVFDTSDPDWTLVGLNGEYGFAPANYIEIQEASTPKSPSAASPRPVPPVSAAQDYEASPVPSSPTSSIQGPAASLARVLGGGAPTSPTASRSLSTSAAPRQQFTPEASDGEADASAPALPQRPPSQSLIPVAAEYTAPINDEPAGVLPSPPYNRAVSQGLDGDNTVRSPGGYHLYNINEMVSAMGKRKKMPTTLGVNIATGSIMLSPEKSRDGPSQEWTADKMTHYSIEGKHVFIELIRPSKSLDLHAGAKDTAQEIVSALGEIAGAFRGEGIKEVLRAASGGGGSGGTKRGQVLYDFMAQGDDEVTVAVGDEVVVLDDIKSEEWWMVRRLKNGKEGVVPSSYIEVTGTIASEPPSRSGINAGRSTVEQNRLEEERLAKEAARANRPRTGSGSEAKGIEVGPGMKLPQRGSSLAGDEDSRRDRRPSRADGKSTKPKPDPKKTRTWTDRSGSFRVDAQFIGLADGKIHLHKQNGVKIAVPTSKMAVEDLEYVEEVTGLSLDDDKPLESIRRKTRAAAENGKSRSSRNGPEAASGVTIELPKPPEYDWFDFFLKAGVGPHQCERYAQNMTKDAVDESDLPDVTQETLRRLGLKEGDILKVMKFLDNKFGRTKPATVGDIINGDAAKTNGGLFTGPDGTLQNNTRRVRPEANRQASDVVNAKLLETREDPTKQPPVESRATPLTTAPKREKIETGFEDDAWEVKRPNQATPASKPQPTSAANTPSQPALSGAMADLSLLSPPLQPTIATPQTPSQPAQQVQTAPPVHSQVTPAVAQQPTPSGADPGFFSQLSPQQTGLPSVQGGFAEPPQFQQQASGTQQFSQINPPRQRPQAPQQSFGPGSLLPPPPRPLSAPQNVQQQSQFGLRPLQPQLTGIPQNAPLQAPPGHSLNELNQQRFQQQYSQQNLQPQPTGFSQQALGGGQFTNGLQPQQTAFQYQNPQFANFQQQQLQQQQQQPPQINGNAIGSPFADPRPSYQSSLAPQQMGYGGFSPQGPPSGGINSVLPPALQPQPTGFAAQQPQALGFQQQQTGFQQPQLNGYQQPQQTGYQQPMPTGFVQPQQTGFQQSQQPQQTGFGQPPQQNGFGNPGFQPPPLPPIPQQPAIAPLQPQKTGPAPPVKFGVTETKKLTPQPTGRRANLSHATPQNPFGF